MPHVEKRLLMHGFVFEDREGRLGAIEQRMARLFDLGICEHVEHLAIGLVRELANHMTRWPLQLGTRRRGRFVGRIDPAREQRLEPAVDARAVQRA